jgi:hypothetical protein
MIGVHSRAKFAAFDENALNLSGRGRASDEYGRCSGTFMRNNYQMSRVHPVITRMSLCEMVSDYIGADDNI